MSDDLKKIMAEQVMGWWHDGACSYMVKGPRFTGYGTDPEDDDAEFWNPPEDMNQAMMCVDKWLKKKRSLTFNLIKLKGTGNFKYKAYLEVFPKSPVDPDDFEPYSADNESAPTAICQVIKEALNE